MKTHLTVKLEYSIEDIEKKIGRSLTKNEIAYLERKLPTTIDNEIGEGLWVFIAGLIESDYLDGVEDESQNPSDNHQEDSPEA